MKAFITNFSATLFMIFAILVIGSLQFSKLPISLYPETTRPIFQVSLNPQSNAQDFRNEYGKDIENKLLGLKGVENVQATYGRSSVEWKVEFDWDIERDRAEIDIRSALSPYESNIPKDWGKFSVFTYSKNSNSGIYLSIHSDTYAPQQLYELITTRIKPKFERIEDLENIFVSKPSNLYARIELNPDKLLSYQISPKQISDILQSKKYDHVLGQLPYESGGQTIKVASSLMDLQKLKRTFISTYDKKDVYLNDVASISLEELPLTFVMHGNGKRSLIVGAQVKKDGNIAKASKALVQLTQEELKNIDPKIQVDVLTNPSEYIEEAISNVEENVILGILISAFILFLFLGSLRYTLIIAISIPLSLLGGVILMALVGMELNLISLGAMALATGIVVDPATVVLENMIRYFEERRPNSLIEKIDCIYDSLLEIKSSVMASLLMSTIVFVPLIFTKPLSRAILGDLSKVMVSVLCISILILIFMPSLFLFLSPKTPVPKTRGIYALVQYFIQGFDYSKKLYLRALRFLLESRRWSYALMSLVCISLLASIYILGFVLKREIIATPDTDKVWFGITVQNSQMSMEETEAFVLGYEQILQKEFGQDMTHFFTQIVKNSAYILCNLKDKKQLDHFKKKLESRFQNTAFVHFFVEPWVPSSLEINKPPLLQLSVEDPDAKSRIRDLEQLYHSVEAIEGVGQVSTQPDFNQTQEYLIRYNDALIQKIKVADPKFSLAAIEDTLKLYLKEESLGSLEHQNQRLELKLAFPKKSIEDLNGIQNLLIPVKEEFIPFRHLAQVELKSDYDSFMTINTQNIAKLKIFVKDSMSSKEESIKAEILKVLATQKNVDTSKIIYEDTDTEIIENLLSLLYALGFALILMGLVLNIQFANFTHSLIIISAIPLGAIGVAISLWGFSSPLCVNSMLGIILLSGIAVNNSIMLVDFFQQLKLRQTQQNLMSLVLECANLRYRPIWITTLTTILGMLPMAFGYGSGGEVLQPLGVAVSGGLTISTLFTLFVVPILIYMSEKNQSSVN